MFMLFVFICCICFFRELMVLYMVVFVVFWMVVVFDFRFCVNFVNDVCVFNFFIVVGLWWIRFVFIFGFNLFMICIIIFCLFIFIFVVFWEILWMNYLMDFVFFWVKFKRLKVWCDIGLNWLMNVVWIVVNEVLIVEFKVLNYVFVVFIRKKGR